MILIKFEYRKNGCCFSFDVLNMHMEKKHSLNYEYKSQCKSNVMMKSWIVKIAWKINLFIL